MPPIMPRTIPTLRRLLSSPRTGGGRITREAQRRSSGQLSNRRCTAIGQAVGGLAQEFRHGVAVAERAQPFLRDDVADGDGDGTADLVADLVEEEGVAQGLVEVGRGLEPAAVLAV